MQAQVCWQPLCHHVENLLENEAAQGQQVQKVGKQLPDVPVWPQVQAPLYVMCAKSLQPCPTLCNPMDCSPPGSSVHEILLARILEWVAMPSSRGIFPTQGLNPCLLCLLHWQVGSLSLAPNGKSIRQPWSSLIQETYVIFSEKYPTADTEGGKAPPTSWLKENLFIFYSKYFWPNTCIFHIKQIWY